MQVTYYEFQKEEVDAAMEGHKNRGSKRSLTHVPSRVENKEAFNILMVRGTPFLETSWGVCDLRRLSTCLALAAVSHDDHIRKVPAVVITRSAQQG